LRILPRTLLVVLLVVAVAAGCSGDGGGRGDAGDGGRTLAAGEQAATTPRGFAVTERVEVGLPSGVLSLGINPDLTSGRTGDAGRVGPAAGVTLVGVSWTQTRHPSSDAFDALLDGRSPESLPRPRLTVLDDDTEIPVDAASVAPGGVLVGVRGPQPALRVETGGQVQTVSLADGTLDAGVAASLTDLAAQGRSLLRVCAAADFPRAAVLDHDCGVDAEYTLPYVAGLGWAPDGQVWLVLDTRVKGRATVRVAGRRGRPLTAPDGEVQRAAWPVSAGAGHTVDFDFGKGIGTVSVRLPG
jgi:hypothetical protein